ncbi:hypothetical protein PtB15_3B239 [Puccinia triticina]|nr:hypothetical protein PtB15_3B239 [Puccinia triticina]
MAPNDSHGIDHNEPSEELELPPLPQPLSPANTTENLSPNATFSSWVNAPKDSPSLVANEFLASTAPQTGPHRVGITRPARQSSPLKPTVRSGATSRSPNTQPAAGLEQQLTAFFDPAAREKRDRDNSMTAFYAMQLRDANKTIESLRNENNRLRMGDQAKSNKLKEKMTELQIENQSLKSKIELMQMMSSNHLFSSQPVPFGRMNYQGSNAHNGLPTANSSTSYPMSELDPTLQMQTE